MSRLTYPIDIEINKRRLKSVVIDPHYEEKHADCVDDQIILQLVLLLDGKIFKPASTDENGFSYFVNDHLEILGKFYKLIWLLHEDEIFIGIVNAYRR